eukprot:612276-Hanusia_phi.AAC.2
MIRWNEGQCGKGEEERSGGRKVQEEWTQEENDPNESYTGMKMSVRVKPEYGSGEGRVEGAGKENEGSMDSLTGR